MKMTFNMSVFLIVIFYCSWSSPSVSGDTQWPSDEPVTDTCGLTALLLHERKVNSEAREETIKKDATIRQLKIDLANANDKLKQMSESDLAAGKLHNNMLELMKDIRTMQSSHCDHVLKNMTNELNYCKSTNADQLMIKEVNELKRANERIVNQYICNNSSSVDNVQIMKSACLAGDTGVVAALLHLGVSCETKLNPDEWTCLFMAARSNKVELVTMLVNNGCDKNTRNKSNQSSPLMEAAYKGFLEVVRILATHGADLSLKSTNGYKTALGWAKHHGKMEVIDYLESVHAPE